MGTTGGSLLRAVRGRQGRTQLWVELEAGLGTGYLQRIESGRVRLPSRTTLEKVLDVLEARYGERRAIFELFGYAVATPPVSELDLVWASQAAQAVLSDYPFPAYVLDCTHRLVAWNEPASRLFDGRGVRGRLERLGGRSLLAAWFESESPLASLIAEPEVFLPAMIRAMRYELRHVAHEPWQEEMLARLLAIPRFRQFWRVTDAEPEPLTANRAQVPLRLRLPDGGTLLFRLSAEPFALDPRFRTVYYFPADADTMAHCSAWVDAGTAHALGG